MYVIDILRAANEVDDDESDRTAAIVCKGLCSRVCSAPFPCLALTSRQQMCRCFDYILTLPSRCQKAASARECVASVSIIGKSLESEFLAAVKRLVPR